MVKSTGSNTYDNATLSFNSPGTANDSNRMSTDDYSATGTKKIFVRPNTGYQFYTETFKGYDGTPLATQIIQASAKASNPASGLAAQLAREHFDFTGWALEEGATAFDFNTPITGAISLIAQYKAQHIVKFLGKMTKTRSEPTSM